MKKVLPILMALFLILPISNAFAYKGGLIEGKNLYIGTNINNTTGGSTPLVTDNSLSTFKAIRSGTYFWTTLSEVSTINEFFLNKTNSEPVIVEYYNASFNLISSNYVFANGSTSLRIPNVLGVSHVGIKGLGFVNIHEFDVYYNSSVPVADLQGAKTFNSIDLSWVNPVSDEIESIIVKSNGIDVATLSKTTKTYSLQNLNPKTIYNIEVIVKYVGGALSEPTTIKVTTDEAPSIPEPEPAGNITKLNADADYDRVDLSWTLPTSENFKHVNIYRDTLSKSLLDKLLGVKTVMAATPIFETNGTYFNDLTVQPETKYEYLLTTISKEGLESDGVSTTVTTLKKPEPEIEGGGYEKDPETGDFTYTWTKPTTGKVKVMINGKLHATVEASNGKIVIPAADMKFTILGNPDVQLIPVDEEGNEGKPVKPPSGGGSGGGGSGGVAELPFSGSDLIKATFNFIKILGPIILLFLIIQLTPRLIKVIRSAIKNKGVDVNAK